MITVRIQNSYSDGHESQTTETVPNPGADLSEWWDEHVWPLTGDGHGIDTGADACHTATIIQSESNPTLVGQSYEWC